MSNKWVFSILIILVFLNDVSIVSASPPARVVAGIVTNVVSTIFKWLWSVAAPVIKQEKAVSTRSLMKFEAGYTVETVFEGSKVGIEPYSVEASPTGELLIMDSVNSNLYKIPTPLSRYSRPKLVAGSPEGYTGHVDGKLRDARMYHPKGLTVDDSGNIYIADTINMAIRKISDAGITTIAGGKWSRGGARIDGVSEDAKFSDDFDLTYVRSSCSLLVTDRGNQAIRKIQLHDADCYYEQPEPVSHEQPEENLPLGVAVLIAAMFSGYMLALLKQRVQALFSTKRDPRMQMNNHAIAAAYQRPPMSVRQPLITPDDEFEEEDEGLFFSFGRLIINASTSVAEVFAGLLFAGFRKKKPRHPDLRPFQHLHRHPDHPWPIQNSYVIRDEDEPPGLETRTSIVRKGYPKLRQNSAYYEGQDVEFPQNQKPLQQQQQLEVPQEQQQQQKQQQPGNVVSNNPKGLGDKGSDKNQVIFGAAQEQDRRREAMVMKAVDYSDPVYNQQNIRPRVNYMGYSAYSYS